MRRIGLLHLSARRVAPAAWLAALLTVSTSLETRAQDDDWSITRDDAPDRPRPRTRGRGRRRTSTTTGEGASRATDLRARYLDIVLADPRDGFAMDRLLALHREGDPGLATLRGTLEARATETPERARAITLVLARLERETGRLAEAEARYRAITVDAAADDAEVRIAEIGLATLARARGELAAARTHLGLARDHASGADRDELVRAIGELSLDLNDFDGAAAAYAELSEGARSVHLRAELPRALAARGEHARAIEAYRVLEREVAGDRRAQVPLLLEIGRAELALGRLTDAIATLETARARAAGSAGVRGEIVELLLDAHRRAGSLESLATAWARASSAEERMARARALDELGHDDLAREAYRRAAAARPRDVEPRLGEIRVALRSGDIDGAIAGYRALLRIAPRPAHVLALAELLEAHGRRDEALAITDGLLRTTRADGVATLDALAGLFSRWGDTERATAALRRRAELSAGDPVPLVALGDHLLTAGDTDAALRTFRRILELPGDRASAHATLGGVYLDHDRVTEAVTELEAALAAHDAAGSEPPIETLRLMAIARERAHDEPRAEAAWRAVLAAAGADETLAREAREHVAASWSRARTMDAHVRELRAAFDADPPDLEAGRFLVEALRRRRDLPGAITVLRALTEHVPDDVALLTLLERLEVQRGDAAGAIDALERLARADPLHAAGHYRRMAEHASDLYRDADAERYARRAVELAPEDADGWERLATLLRERGDLPGAATALRRAVSLDPRRYELARDLSELELARGERAAAEALWLAIIAGSPDDALVTEAMRGVLDLHHDDPAGLLPLESALLGQVLRAPERGALRRAYVELSYVRIAPLAARPDDPDAQAELARIVTRGLAPLLLSIAGTDPDEAARAIALVRMARIRAAAGAILVRAERGRDPEARLEALATVASLAGPEHAARLSALARAPTEGEPIDPAVRALATWALGRALAGDPMARARAIAPLLEDGAREVRAYAALALGGTSDRAIPEVARAAAQRAYEAGGADGPLLAWAFARTFATLVASRPATTPLALASLARTELPIAMRAVIQAMLDDGSRSSAVGALKSALVLPDDVDPRPSESAAAFLSRALGERPVDLSSIEDELAAVLGPALATPGDPRGVAALRLLSPIVVDGAPHVTLEGIASRTGPRAVVPAGTLEAIASALRGWLEAPEPALRARAAALLAASGDRDDPGLYERAASDPDPSVLRAALEARGDSSTPAALVAFLVHTATTHTDWSARAAAAHALGRAPTDDDAAGADPAVDALATIATDDPYALVRDAAVRALSSRARLGATGRAALESACEGDPEPRVRASACAATSP